MLLRKVNNHKAVMKFLDNYFGESSFAPDSKFILGKHFMVEILSDDVRATNHASRLVDHVIEKLKIMPDELGQHLDFTAQYPIIVNCIPECGFKVFFGYYDEDSIDLEKFSHEFLNRPLDNMYLNGNISVKCFDKNNYKQFNSVNKTIAFYDAKCILVDMMEEDDLSRSAFVHELIHFMDDEKAILNKQQKKADKDPINSHQERNAYFNQILSTIIVSLKLLKKENPYSYNKLIDYFKRNVVNNDGNRKDVKREDVPDSSYAFNMVMHQFRNIIDTVYLDKVSKDNKKIFLKRLYRALASLTDEKSPIYGEVGNNIPVKKNTK